MNWDRIEGNWKQFSGKVKQQWGKLTEDDLEVVEGRRVELVGKDSGEIRHCQGRGGEAGRHLDAQYVSETTVRRGGRCRPRAAELPRRAGSQCRHFFQFRARLALDVSV